MLDCRCNRLLQELLQHRLALVGLVGFLYLERLSSLESPAEVAAEDSARANRPSVAVMAFENMSDDPSAEYFGDGLAEEILNLLAQLTELDVAARGKQVVESYSASVAHSN